MTRWLETALTKGFSKDKLKEGKTWFATKTKTSYEKYPIIRTHRLELTMTPYQLNSSIELKVNSHSFDVKKKE